LREPHAHFFIPPAISVAGRLPYDQSPEGLLRSLSESIQTFSFTCEISPLMVSILFLVGRSCAGFETAGLSARLRVFEHFLGFFRVLLFSSLHLWPPEMATSCPIAVILRFVSPVWSGPFPNT